MNKKDKKSIIKNLKVGDFYSRSSYGKIVGFEPDGDILIANEDPTMKPWSISPGLVEAEFYIHNQSTKEVKVTRTELADIFISHPRMVMTVNYNKQLKVEDVNKALYGLYANKDGKLLSETIYKSKVRKITKEMIVGEERTMVGRHEAAIDDFGRMHFTDVEVARDEKKFAKDGYDSRHRLVDPRTINWMIVANTTYVVKK